MKDVSASCMKGVLLGSIVCLWLVGQVARADYTFGTPVNLGPTVNSEAWELSHCVSADGLELYFGSDRAGGIGYMDVWVSTRPSIDAPWGSPQNLGPVVNSPHPYEDMGPCISTDGLELYFQSDRPGGLGGGDIWVTRRPTREDPWEKPVNLGSPVNSEGWDYNPSLSSDGLELYLALGPAVELEPTVLAVATRETTDDPWGVPVRLDPAVNNWTCQDTPWISSDGLLLTYTDFWLCSPRPGGFGETDIWLTRRASKEDDWAIPGNLGPPVNTEFAEDAATISPDGSMLYFNSDRPGGSGTYDIWQVSIEPVVDLNGDGIVDAQDMCIVVDNWGTNEPSCDIGPMPWGDGIVDVQDLIVISEHLFEVYPSADTVDVNEADDGVQIELELGKLLVVTLESNPSTGYRWELVDNHESILKQFGEVEFKPSETGDPPVVGAGGWEIFRFKATSPGQTTLQMIYHRSWEEGVEPLKTFSIQVVVR